MRVNRLHIWAWGSLFSIACMVMFFMLAPKVHAAGITNDLSFEGKVVTSAGINIPNGTYNMEFKIYSGGTATGGGTLLWTEDWLVANGQGVTFSGGTYEVNLGSICSFSGGSCETYTNSAINWNSSPLYLSLQIGNTASCSVTTSFQSDCGGDGEMTPYILLTSTPYSFNSSELNGLTSSAFGQLAAAQTWTGPNNFESSTNSTSAFTIQNSSATDLFVADTTDGRIGIGTATPIGQLNLESSSYISNQMVISDGVTGTPNTYPNSYLPSLVVQTAETTGSRPLFFGYNAGSSWGAFLTSGACGSFAQMCLDLGSGSTATTALVNEGSNLYVGGGPDGNFSNVIVPDNTSLLGLTLGNTTTSGQVTFDSSGGSNVIAINAPATNPSSSYTLTLPIATPATSQCLEAGATTATDLIFGACTSIGTLDGGTANANGATISGTGLYLQSASASYPGLVNTTTQTFAGAKTFGSTLTVTGATSLSSTLNVSGTTTLSGGAAISSFSGGTWINLPTTGPSGIGSGGAGADAWLGYAYGNGNWFTNALAGDINFRNTSGSLNFGNSSNALTVSIVGNEVGIGNRGPTSLLDVSGPIATAIKTVTANYTVASTDSTILASGSITVTLPSASGISGREYIIKNIGASTVTVASSSGLIDGSSTFSLGSQYETITVQSDGTNWWIISSSASSHSYL